ncbi:hypothetical protein B9Z55_014577 [Caenorhabditis nigoni]|uniref:Uncharacterized protein n=1 Tax=Caenorhabditis nigoni TaxID=1611254 RepID=A0A2G5U780_9PELO|nr:hypothetical protein B9Z55_014577 [Caenorhabditis nigoni]
MFEFKPNYYRLSMHSCIVGIESRIGNNDVERLETIYKREKHPVSQINKIPNNTGKSKNCHTAPRDKSNEEAIVEGYKNVDYGTG